ncbi:MAG: hypothetical protein HYU37_09225 [Acidobacteria bacterium]|nr:hypothetical protein [Acidobacteriota bacterium]
MIEGYGNLPLNFEVNHGQSAPEVKFLARGTGYSLFLTSNETLLVLGPSNAARRSTSALLRMRLVKANPVPQATGQDELPGKSNYFIGHDPAGWRTNIPTYAKVAYKDVYPGVE